MSKKRIVLSLALILVPVFLFAGGQNETKTDVEVKSITVFNAASTTDLVNEIADLFTGDTGIIVKTNPASSGTLAKQLEEGAEADVYISASKKWMDYVNELQIVSESKPFVINRLVLVAPSDTVIKPFKLGPDTDFPALFGGRLSMGEPAHVPAGKYAEEALQYYKWDTALADRILPAADVRAALSVVELGETELGIVYETDAKKSNNVVIVSYFPEESHSPIEYFIALLNDSSAGGREFYDFMLTNSTVAEIYTKYGFSFYK